MRFKPSCLVLNPECNLENFSIKFIEACRKDAVCHKCYSFQDIKNNGFAYYDDDDDDTEEVPSEDHLRRCDQTRLRDQYLDDDGMYRDPWMSGVLRTIGPEMMDLSVHGEEAITADLFVEILNLTALRLFWHHPWIFGLLPQYCHNLVTLEFVGPFTVTDPIVEHLTDYEYTPLRALAIFNVIEGHGNVVTVAHINALGTTK